MSIGSVKSWADLTPSTFYTTTLDHIVKIANRLDQERIFTTEWVKRIESEVEKHRQEIEKIKEILKIG